MLKGNSCLNTAPADVGQGLRKISNTFPCNTLSVSKRRLWHKPSSSKTTVAWLREPQHQPQLWKNILSSVQCVTEEFAEAATSLSGKVIQVKSLLPSMMKNHLWHAGYRHSQLLCPGLSKEQIQQLTDGLARLQKACSSPH